MTIGERERKSTRGVWILCSIFAFTSHVIPITPLQPPGQLPDAYFVVHLVTGQYGTGDTGFHFGIFIFLMLARKEEKNGLENKHTWTCEPGTPGAWKPALRFFRGWELYCQSFRWGSGFLSRDEVFLSSCLLSLTRTQLGETASTEEAD